MHMNIKIVDFLIYWTPHIQSSYQNDISQIAISKHIIFLIINRVIIPVGTVKSNELREASIKWLQ